MFQFEPMNLTDNHGLDGAVEHLEKIYKTIDWPLKKASLSVSLHQSGKSRSDLWQLAGLVALEEALERANRACDLDYHGRQQVDSTFLYEIMRFLKLNYYIFLGYTVGRA